MADSILLALQVTSGLTAFVAVLAGAISAGRMLLHLRKHDLGVYARLGEPSVLSRSGSPLTQQYLREKRYLQSGSELVQLWGRRYHMFLRVAFIGFAICVAAMAVSVVLAI